MNRFLRAIRRCKWYKYPRVDWLQDCELKGDALSDIQAHQGRLSVYLVANEIDSQRVAVAIAATKG